MCTQFKYKNTDSGDSGLVNVAKLFTQYKLQFDQTQANF